MKKMKRIYCKHCGEWIGTKTDRIFDIDIIDKDLGEAHMTGAFIPEGTKCVECKKELEIEEG